MKEEQILFPYIIAMDSVQTTGEPLPHSCFGTVQNPIRMMFLEHDNAGDALKQLRQLTSNYTAPADGCISYEKLYSALADFEADLHQHIHKENNILFPRAVELESK
jgi:regulator of cell morphogenesis and NO signaling